MGFGRCCDHDDLHFGLALLCLAPLDNTHTPHTVISEAYTSRYKGILGRNSFKHVVRQYRERNKVELSEKVQRIGTSTGVKFVLHDTFEREETDVVEDGSSPPSATADDTTIPAVASTSKPDPQHAKRSLEQLPQQILTETRSIHQYMQLNGDFDGHSTEAERFVDESVWSLIDDVVGGKKLTECTKMDILKDGESRQVRGLAVFHLFFQMRADFLISMAHRR